MNTRAFVAELPFLGQVDEVDLLLLGLCAAVVLLLLATLCRCADAIIVVCLLFFNFHV